MNVGRIEVLTGIESLQLHNKVVFAHCSMHSFGSVSGGAEGLLQHFLSQGCTVVVPTFTYAPLCEMPAASTYEQNGHRDSQNVTTSPNPLPSLPYRADDNDIEPAMGQFAKTVLSHPKRVRTEHPLNSFAAVGPSAADVLAPQTNLNVYGVYQSDAAKAAVVLAMGTAEKSLTPIHYAEQLAGRTLFRRWAKTASRGTVETAIGSCSEGFRRLRGALMPCANQTLVGNSLWVSYPLHALLDACAKAISATPNITICQPDCPRCADMAKGGLLL